MTARGSITQSTYVTQFRLEILNDFVKYGVTDALTVSCDAYK